MLLRFAEISNWLAGLFPVAEIKSLMYMESDASARKYLRCIFNNQNYIIMDTVPGVELVNFISIAEMFATNKINAPQIIRSDLERGLVLMNDFGNITYQEVLKTGDIEVVQQLYLDAIYALIKIQNVSQEAILPIMDASYILDRLDVFKTWYLDKHLEVEPSANIDIVIANAGKLFVEVFNEQHYVLVHVDYHCRNLMYIHNTTNPGILDFQDAMYGPPTYDLVSLFQDAYVTWPRAQVEAWVKMYYDLALAAGILKPQEFSVFLRNFDMVGLQRHLKNLGVFARLHHRDKKSGYLQHIPTLLKYITETCERYPELQDLLEYLTSTVVA